MELVIIIFIQLGLLIDSCLCFASIIQMNHDSVLVPLTILLITQVAFMACNIIVKKNILILNAVIQQIFQLTFALTSLILYCEFFRISNIIIQVKQYPINLVFQGLYTALIISYTNCQRIYQAGFFLLTLCYLFINFNFSFNDRLYFLVKLIIFIVWAVCIYYYTFNKSNFLTDPLMMVDLQNFTDELIILIDESFNLLHCNQALLDYFKKSKTEIVEALLQMQVEVTSNILYEQINSPRGESDKLNDTIELKQFLMNVNKLTGSLGYHKVYIQTQNNKIQSRIIIKKLVLKESLFIISIQDSTTSDIENQEMASKQINKVSHEMRTPLNAIISMLECLEKDIDEYLRRVYVKPCLNSARLLLSLLNDILDHAQLGKNKLELNIVSFNLKRLISKITDIFEIQAQKRMINLQIQFDNRLPYKIRTDQNRLRQIIINLVSNALKFTKNRGTIKLSCQLISKSLIRIGVKDDGVGIAKENQAKLFQEFGKIVTKETKTINSQGVGLGLQISQELAILLGPKQGVGLQIESNINQGAEFYFLIQNHKAPCSEENISESDCSGIYTVKKFQQGQIRKQVQFKNNNNNINLSLQSLENNTNWKRAGSITSFNISSGQLILIVDDNTFNVMALTFQLEKLGLKSDSCYSGKDAIQMVKERKQAGEDYKLIFMDVEMPEMDGFETTKQILKITKSSIIIGCTGYQTDQDKQKCLQAGMHEVTDKPVQNKTLKMLLKRIMKFE